MFVDILIVALVANIITDVYELGLERLLGKTRDWHLVGRWFVNVFKGSFVLDPTDETRVVPGELALGWVFHYIVAIAYVAAYLMGVRLILDEAPSFGTAIGFGIITVAAPWFVLIPGLGAGVFATNAERPNFVRLTSLTVHAVFGVGIYLGVIVASLV